MEYLSSVSLVPLWCLSLQKLQTFSHVSTFNLHTVLPVTDTNNLKVKNFKQWIKWRKLVEKIETEKRTFNEISPHNLVECPLSTDVVFKVGTSSWNHPGNARYRELLELHLHEYINVTSTVAKEAVAQKILQDTMEQKGRFLEWSKENNCWTVLGDKTEIRTKIYNNMVYFGRQTKAKKNLQSSTSCTWMFQRQDGRKRKRDKETQCCTNSI